MYILKKFIRLLLVLSFTLSFAQLAYCTDFSTHTNEEYNFSIDIPNSWRIVAKNKSSDKKIMALSEDGKEILYICAYNKPAGISPLTNMTFERIKRIEIPALRNMTSEQVEILAQTFIDKTLNVNIGRCLNYQLTSINEYPCLFFQFESALQMNIRLFLFIEDSKLIQLFHIADRDSTEKETPLIEKSINSFKMF